MLTQDFNKSSAWKSGFTRKQNDYKITPRKKKQMKHQGLTVNLIFISLYDKHFVKKNTQKRTN